MTRSSAFGRFVADVRKDHDVMVRHHAKYGGRSPEGGPIARDLVEKVGFQLLAAYRTMRFFQSTDAKLPAQIASRVIRHLYGSDIHWDADIAPGVMVVHGMGMAISRSAKIDEDVVLFQHCTLGEGRHPETGEVGAPHVERGVVVGAGATLIGPITIGAWSKIMPGCVVVRSVPPNSIVEAPTVTIRGRAGRDARTDDDTNGGAQ
jgi:serine O-acetyltransferase